MELPVGWVERSETQHPTFSDSLLMARELVSLCQQTLYGGCKVFKYEGFHKEGIQAQLPGLFWCHGATETGTEDNRDIWLDAPDLLREFGPGKIRHSLVRDNQVELVGCGTKGF